MLEALKLIKKCAIETEPLTMGSQRYGNKAFRHFCDKISAVDHPLLPAFTVKMLNLSFGNATRLDYGTGHELFFLIACMTAVHSLETISAEFAAVMGGRIICSVYLDLVRFIQERYSLEPAGSHGVWGLDDYQFAPFLLGSAQLIGFDEEISTAAAVEPAIFNNSKLQNDFAYLQAIAHVHRLKTRGSACLQFASHSPLLHSISGVPTWQRVHEGLGRMYVKEVLSKLPVVQHLQFDSDLFPINLTVTDYALVKMNWIQLVIVLVSLLLHVEKIVKLLEDFNLAYFIQSLSLHDDIFLISLSKLQETLQKETPLELIHKIFSYLRQDLIPLSCSCRYFYHEVSSYIKAYNAKVIPSLTVAPYAIHGVLFSYFIDFLNLNFPRLRAEHVLIKDLVGLCHLHSKTYEELSASEFMRHLIYFEDEDFIFFFRDHIISTYSNVAVSHGLFFTAEYLLSMGKISQMKYFRNIVRMPKVEGRLKFFERALEFENPFQLLERNFDSCFALLLYKISNEEIKQSILLLTVDNISCFSEPNDEYSFELVLEIAKQPELLNKAFADHYFGNGLKCLLLAPSDEQILVLEDGPHWMSLRYLIQLQAFNAEEFQKKVPFSQDAIEMLPMLNLNETYFFDAFLHLIRGHDFSNSDELASSLHYCCAKSIVPEYLWLVTNFSNALLQSAIKFNYVSSYTCKLTEGVGKDLSLFDLMTFHPKSDWKVLKPILHDLDISQPVYVDYKLLFDNCYPNPQYFIVDTDGIEAWSPLLLAVATYNFGAVEAILTHPNFQPETKKDMVVGMRLDDMLCILYRIRELRVKRFTEQLRILLDEYLK